MTNEELEEAQAETSDFASELAKATNHMICAVSCETAKDFSENLKELRFSLKAIIEDIDGILKKVK